jgi:hypothetical protein
MGWEFLERAECHGRSVAVMRRQTGAGIA